MSYIAVTLNHFKVIQAWVAANGADAQLDVKTFELEVKARNRYFRLHPQFLARMSGRLAHVGSLTKEANGFIGWLPYKPVRWDLSNDKLVFKRFLAGKNLPTPASSPGPQAPAHDYIFKRSVGSFGYELYGPYRAGDANVPQPAATGTDRGELYMEEFIEGRNLKAWFWGATPIYAHLHDYPAVTGDGKADLAALISRKLSAAGQALDDPREMASVRSSLAYQQLSMEQVLPQGRTAWIDYRYGRIFQPIVIGSSSDNDLPAMDPGAREQLARIGQAVAAALQREFPAPVMYSLDGVMTDSGKIWWLEMNSNPILPPDGYPVILDSLFGFQAPQQGRVEHAA